MRPVSFLKKLQKEREKCGLVFIITSLFVLIISAILKWFVDPEVAEQAITMKTPIEEHQVETVPTKITSSCLDENISLDSCRKMYFKEDAMHGLL